MNKTIEELRNKQIELETQRTRKQEIVKKLQEHRSALQKDELTTMQGEVTEVNKQVRQLEIDISALQTRAENEGEFRMENVQNIEEIENRAKTLKTGGVVRLESRAVTSSQTAMSVVASANINPAFNQASTLDQLVKIVRMNGGESYRSAYAKTVGEGGVTKEGAAYTDAEPKFDYAEINKVKITAYAEVSEEVEKLPNADYESNIRAAVITALRRKKIQQIIAGTGTGEFVGMINAPAKIIDADQTKTIATLTETFVDDIIYKYGGDEDVEGDACIIMNKFTLGQLAKIRSTQEKRKIFDIKVNGNTATIDSIPVILTSKLPAYSATLAPDTAYVIYGKLTAYEIAEFSDIEVSRSTDYKFKEGMVAYKVSQMCGGSPAMYNGFMKIVRSTSVQTTSTKV